MSSFEDGFETFDLIGDLGVPEPFGDGSSAGNDLFDNGADKLLDGLNPEQREAVMHLDGPLLILAGAGSGKTRVITYRIAYMMLKHNVRPGSILAITFTNKAANEMKERIEGLVSSGSQYIWTGTFHSIFARILRRHAEVIGYGKNFTIIDTDDQQKMIKQVMQELELSEKIYKPRNFSAMISNNKNQMIEPEEYSKMAGNDQNMVVNARVYKKYQARLVENNVMDFDDILVNMVKLFRTDKEILEFYQRKFQYIMVDEYQDTNKAQYMAVKALAGGHRNLCVVGDDDQSIYAFRGADVRMILSFEKDFTDAKVIKLEQNYRSTKTILDAANEVIAHNQSRKRKTLRTDGEQGDKIILMNADSHNEEASFVAETIKRFVDKGKYKYSDIAILYRMNALSRTIESALREKTIPFKVFGGMRFYDRKEIKDILAYLRLINDSHDNLAFERIINVPKRGIGDTTIDRIHQIAIEDGISCLEIAGDAYSYPELTRSASKLTEFYSLIMEMRAELNKDEMRFDEFIEMVENRSGIVDDIVEQREKKGELIDRVENLKELLSEAVEFEKKRRTNPNSGVHLNQNSEDVDTSLGGEARNAAKAAGEVLFEMEEDMHASEVELDPMLDEETKTVDTLAGLLSVYLENAALYTAGDEAVEGDDFVKVMSIHSAKGLEFGAVFLIGVEESIFPNYKSMSSEKDLEEERRLMYVAITRAKKNLMIVVTRRRMLFGQTQCNAPSRFLREISSEHLYKMGSARPSRDIEMPQVGTSKARDEAKKNIASALSSKFVSSKPASVSRGAAQGQSGSSGGFASSGKTKKIGGLDPASVFVGMKVSHARFGEGTIIKCEQIANDALVTVDFDGNMKNMLVRTSGLKKV